MISTQQYLDLLATDFTIIRYLAAKLKESDLDYKPTPKQRTTLELLQYMSYAFDTTAVAIVTGDASVWGSRSEAAKSLVLADFDTTMAAQELNLHTWFKQLSAEQLAEEVDMFGVKSRAMHFMNMLKWVTSYKMQLFLYMKSIGYHHLNTMNVWAGIDGEM